MEKKYTRLVSGTLAGALAVGMVPAMALADDSVEMLATDDLSVIKAGTISAFVGGANPATEFVKGDTEAIKAIIPTAVEEGGATEGVEYNVCGYKYVKIDPKATVGAGDTDFVIVGGKKVKIADGAAMVPVMENGAAVDGNSLPAATGTYAIFAQAYVDADEDSVYDSGEATQWVDNGVAFTVVNKAVTGELAFYEIATVDGEVVTADTTHVYKGENYKFDRTGNFQTGYLGVSADGVALEYSDDYTISNIVVKDANTNLEASDRAAAGEYYVEVEFDGVYKNVYYDIEKFDVKEADIELVSNTVALNQASSSAFAIESVNDNAGDSFNMVKIIGTSANFDSENLVPGEYTVTVGLSDAYAEDPSCVAGSTQDIKVAVVGSVISNLVLTYPLGTAGVTADSADDAASTKTTDYSVDRSAADYTSAKEFDVSKLIVTDGSGKVYTNVKPVVSKKNVYGEYVECDASELTDGSWGEYQVKAVLVDSTYATAGETAAIEVSITNGAIQNADVAYAYKNANVTTNKFNAVENGVTSTGTAITYSGADFMDDLAVSVKCNGKAVAASDYSIVVEKWNVKTGKYEAWTGGVVDRGEYKIYVSSAKYNTKGQDNAIYVDIVPVDVKAYRADQVKTTKDGKFAANEFLYTGEAVNPVEFFAVSDGQGSFVKKDGEYQIVDVPASAYKLVITKFVPEGETAAVLNKDLPTDFVEPGTYTYSILDTATATVIDNYAIDEVAGRELVITSLSVFPDVASDAWYADEVLLVAQNEWITGYSNGNFGPNDGMKRGDLALVIARYLDMTAPKDTAADGTIGGLTNAAVDTGFADVKGTAYYAWAIKAMDEAGIMTGYDNGKFGAEELVTRQQLATILARLDESGLGDASILASALDAYADADEVAGWAAEGVEWAVENGIMGVDTAFLNPTDTVTRAEVAAMIVRNDAL